MEDHLNLSCSHCFLKSGPFKENMKNKTTSNRECFAKEEKTKKKQKAEKNNKQKLSVIEDEDPPNLIRLDKQQNFCRVEYELLKGKCRYSFDVLCWEKAVKIISPDSVKIFRTVTKNGLVFAPVCVEHQFNELSIGDLTALQSSVIEFQVFIDKKKMGNVAKADKSTIFYVKEIDIDYEGFVEARIEETHLVKSKSISRTSAKAANITNDQNGSVDKEGSFMVYRDDFNELFSDMMEFAINKTRPPHLKFRDFVKPCKMEGSKTDVKKGLKKTEQPDIKKKKGPKEKAEKSVTKLNLQMQGETFFTDPEMSIFSVEQYKASVPKFLVAASVNRLLTRSQKIELNPMVVKIKKIADFPSEVFDNTGYTDIFCKFSIPFVAGCTTIEKPIDKTIYFDESHIYFTNHLPKIKLLEYLDSRRFIVEIYGVKRYVTSDITPKIFGENHWDKNIAKVYPNIPKDYTKQFEESQPEYVLLGYCSYDLSSLLRNVWDFRGIAQIHSKECTNFRNISIKNQVPEPYTRGLPVNTINLANINAELNSSSKPVLREWLLMEKGTSLTVEVYLLSPQAPSLVLHQIPNTYKRLMLIAFKKQVATQFLSKIWDHNQRIMCQKLDESDLITGFIIDNGNDVIIYIEGLSTGFILNLWNDLNLSNSRQMKIFFNTDQAYENRLYNICSSSCSFYTIILKVPLQHIFKDRRVYIKGNAPLLCWKAITRLHLLLHSQTLTSMLRYELLPSIEELCSLNLEYGVPLTWKLPETDDNASTNTL